MAFIFILLFSFLTSLLAHGKNTQSNVYLVEWQPTPYHGRFIIPALRGETPLDAVKAYIETVLKDIDLGRVGPGRIILNTPLEDGKIVEFKQQNQTSVLLVANRHADHLANSQRIKEMSLPFIERGLTPFVLPVGASLRLTKPYEFHKTLSHSFPGLVLLGGDDVHPRIYKRSITYSENININELRDKLEIKLYRDYVGQKNGFVLGICRGSQLINIAESGSMHQDLNTILNTPIKHGAGEHDNITYHHIRLIPTQHSLLSRALGDNDFSNIKKWTVNSFHHQGSVLKAGGHVQAAAVSEDGVVEAIEVGENILGTQSHPERKDPSGFGSKVFNYVVTRISSFTKSITKPLNSCDIQLQQIAN
ncbi:MAG: gamma-glutamyl-gamma-aminobutyrate hydrolase family protein [Bdellovibrionaceae bacterium]|nr:gamma-glutamyl-gamma-aminobutyrate hydrolase family protein [Pseudobdellovibrionaceae bacterium]